MSQSGRGEEAGDRERYRRFETSANVPRKAWTVFLFGEQNGFIDHELEFSSITTVFEPLGRCAETAFRAGNR
jgi:hypothetical protein